MRIFPSHRFQRVAWCTILLVSLNTMLFVLLNIFQCTPIDLAWKSWNEQQYEGRCLYLQVMGCSQAAINMLLDLFILAMPMPTLYKLNTTWIKKLQVLIMFSVGLIVVVISILRLAWLIIDFNVVNITWITWNLGLWDAAEVYVSIICVCLPSAKTAGERVFARCFGSKDNDPQQCRMTGASSWCYILKRTSTTISRLDVPDPGGDVSAGAAVADATTAMDISPRPRWVPGFRTTGSVLTSSTTISAGSHSLSHTDFQSTAIRQ